MALVRTHTLSWWLIWLEHGPGTPGEVPVTETAENSFSHFTFLSICSDFLLQEHCLLAGAGEMKAMRMGEDTCFKVTWGWKKQC